RAADYIVDIGPGAGEHGGQIVAEGTLSDMLKNKNSITGQFLSGAEQIPMRRARRTPQRKITLRGARQHNLKIIDVDFPLGCLVCVTGVSGSGKSTLVEDILHARLAYEVNRQSTIWGEHDSVEGIEQIDKVINIDQSPIGRTP